MSRKPKKPPVSDRDLLEAFVRECEKLDNHKYNRLDFKPTVKINIEDDQPWSYSVSEPDPELLDSYLIRLRRFMSDGEQICVHSVRNIARRHLSEGQLRERLDELPKQWKEQMEGGGVALSIDGKDITLDLAWDLYVNGELFHFNIEKQRELRDNSSPDQAWMYRFRFLCQIDYATVYVFAVGRVIREALRTGAFDFAKDD